ncbi:MAG TPA: substrate-binding domain-containing protein [Verrucomicrobiae bacterium]|nr:substrate-binding domain-containing protein [Verrucomicrobiae bacterium]
MKQRILSACIAALLAVTNGCAPSAPPQKPVIRVAVIGGMVMTGMWQELAKQFETNMGYKVQLVAAGPKPVLVEAFHRGEADLLTMHSSDEATDLVADGYAVNMRPWARNELVIVGPPEDPAHIKGMTNGVAALQKIAAAHAPFVDFHDPGSRQVAARLWHIAGFEPQGDWVLKDESKIRQEVVIFAEKHHAYVIVGRIPVLKGKIQSGSMQILVEGDPEMRRPFVVMIANAKRLPHANVAGAQVLADYLTSEKGQQFLKDFAAKQPDGVPLFYPLDDNSGVVHP